MSRNQQCEHLYETIARELADQIRAGRFNPGDKIPGTRLLAENFGVSINTILQTQKLLENWGLIESMPRSGFYVKWQASATSELQSDSPKPRLSPTLIRRHQLTLDLIHDSGRLEMTQLGSALPDAEFFPSAELQRIAARIARQRDDGFGYYEVPPGLPTLRESLAQRMLGFGCRVSDADILITSGCHEALLLALKCVTERDDVILLESPGYIGLLQIIDSLGLRAVAIPAHPETGINLDSIRSACEKWPVKACVLVSNFNNPAGNISGDDHKQALLSLLNDFRVPLVEDDIFGDLAFSGVRPAPYKKFDRNGEVLYCNSFSKTVAPGLRVGWLSPGRYIEKAAYLKLAQNIATPTFNQAVLDDYLRNGNVDKHIRKLRQVFASNVGQVIDLIQTDFPEGTKISYPQGGFLLWVKLPERYDTAELYQQALKENIYIAPGKLFSTDRHFHSFLRINCALPADTVLKPALTALAALLRNGLPG